MEQHDRTLRNPRSDEPRMPVKANATPEEISKIDFAARELGLTRSALLVAGACRIAEEAAVADA